MPLPKGRHLSLNFKLLALFGEKRGRLVYDTFVVLILPAYKNEGWLDAGYWVLGIGYWMVVGDPIFKRGYSILDAGYRKIVIGYWSLAVR